MRPDVRPSWYWESNWEDFRRGGRQVVLRWGDEQVDGRLYDEGTPRTAAAVRARLPLTVPVVHVAWSGEMVMSAEPVAIESQGEENSVRLVRPGDLAFDATYGEISVTYGTAECRLPSGPNTLVVFGQVDPDHALLRRLGRACRFEGMQQITLLEAGGR